MANGDKCRVDNCDSHRAGRSTLCQVHKYRWQKYKSYDAPIRNKYFQPLDGIKICHLCKLPLDLPSYARTEINKKSGRCKSCVIQKVKESRLKKTSEEWREYYKIWHLKDLVKNRARKRKYFLKKYGLSIQDYVDLSESQSHKCKICGQLGNGFDKGWETFRCLAVDHCHKTGKVRGLLCTRCNNALGAFKDNVELLMTAAEYLKAHQEA